MVRAEADEDLAEAGKSLEELRSSFSFFANWMPTRLFSAVMGETSLAARLIRQIAAHPRYGLQSPKSKPGANSSRQKPASFIQNRLFVPRQSDQN
jgi:hypothetical protein